MANNDIKLEFFDTIYQKRLNSKEFSESIDLFWADLWQDISSIQINEICTEIEDALTQTEPSSLANPQLNEQINILIDNFTIFYKSFHPIVKENIITENKTLREFADEKTIVAWDQVVEQPIRFKREIVDNAINHPAIKELLVNLIHEAIISFNKKFNPFFGAVSVLGIDKQIKDFISLFMDSAMHIVTDFIVDEKNRSRFGQYQVELFHLLIGQKPRIFFHSLSPETEEKLNEAVKISANDKLLQENISQSIKKIISQIKKTYPDKTIRDLTASMNGNTPPLTDYQKQILCKMLSRPSFTRFAWREYVHLTEEIK